MFLTAVCGPNGVDFPRSYVPDFGHRRRLVRRGVTALGCLCSTGGTSASPARCIASTGDNNMAEKFDPAPHDKHAESPREAVKADREMHENLEAGLVGSFP